MTTAEIETVMETTTTAPLEELAVNVDLEMNDDYKTTVMDSTTSAPVMDDKTTVQINLKVIKIFLYYFLVIKDSKRVIFVV